MPGEKDDKGFKVIDRRGREEEPSPPPAAPPVENRGTDPIPPKGAREGSPPPDGKEGNLSPPAGIQGEEGRAREGAYALGGPRFLDIVQSLQMGAMVGLGMLQGRDGKRPPVDLPAAKDAIDLLGILQEKTKGNLTKEEEEILREGLYHLRMGYMAMINAPPAGRKKEGDQR
jgi:hypothetical protein